MRFQPGLIIALFLAIWGCSRAPYNQNSPTQSKTDGARPEAEIAPPPSPPTSVSPSSSVSPTQETAPSPALEKEPLQSPKPDSNSEKIPMFHTCKEAKANGYSNIDVLKHPEYASKDRDKDGVACES